MPLTYIPKPQLRPDDPLRFSGSMYTSMDACMARWAATYIYKQTEDDESNALTGSYFVIGHGLHAGAEYYLEDLLAAIKGKKKSFKSDFVARGIKVYFDEIARLGGTEKIEWPGNWGPLAGTIDDLLTAALAAHGMTFTRKTDPGKIRKAIPDGWLNWVPENAGMNADGALVYDLGKDEKTPFDDISEAGVPQFDDLDADAKKELMLSVWSAIWNSLNWPESWSGEIRAKCSIGGFLTADRFADWSAYQLSQFPQAYAELDVTPVASELNFAPYDPKTLTGVKVPEAINLWLTGTADHIARDNKTGKLVLIDWKTAATAEDYLVPGFAQRSMQLNHYVYLGEYVLSHPEHDLHKAMLKLGFKKGETFSGVQYVVFAKKPMPAGWSRDQLELPKLWPVAYKAKKADAETETEDAKLPQIVAAERAEVTDAMRDAFLKGLLEREADLRDDDRQLRPSSAGAYNSPCSHCPVAEWCTTGNEDKLQAITYNLPPSEEDM